MMFSCLPAVLALTLGRLAIAVTDDVGGGGLALAWGEEGKNLQIELVTVRLHG